MQEKLYKRSTLILGLILLVDAATIVYLFLNKELWISNKATVIAIFVLVILLSTFIYAYYDLNADRNIVRKAVKNGDVAMAKIIDGSFVRFARDSRLRNHVYWKLKAELYDDDMNPHDITIIEKFSTHQTKIPTGFVYVTYNPNKLNDSLIIPNVIISSIPEYQLLVETYEKALKPKYLNAYYNNGLILQTYSDSMKQQKQYYKDFLKKVNN